MSQITSEDFGLKTHIIGAGTLTTGIELGEAGVLPGTPEFMAEQQIQEHRRSKQEFNSQAWAPSTHDDEGNPARWAAFVMGAFRFLLIVATLLWIPYSALLLRFDGFLHLYPVLVIVGFVSYLIQRKVKKSAREKASHDALMREKQERVNNRLALVKKQKELEEAEMQRKASMPVIGMDEFFADPRRFRSVFKYDIVYSGDKRVEFSFNHPLDSETIEVREAAFYIDNKFAVRGQLVFGTYGFFRRFHIQPKPEENGYAMGAARGFVLHLDVETPSGNRRVIVVTPYEYQAPRVASSEYAPADNGPFDVFKGRACIGATLQAKGDLFRRLTAFGEGERARAEPEGYYILADFVDVSFIK